MTTYQGYLELHAMRAPVGNYATWVTRDDNQYDAAVGVAIAEFEQRHGITIYTLGRSGRHVCIEDTPENRKRYFVLQAAAIQAARELWQEMQTEREPDAVLSE